ncbi:MAG: hypothetical protein OEY18_05635 [Candidatus Aminicenantes bacterium]|nr:hypothetical protein [Candidatus Aminicenantes bacterium]MDH5384171.1 hypothetical protein [Candidatus Aminicenantes bacterium]MDH5744086.1 hypothetical protein [Candidatus Aminicenantes bacterium]
MKKMKNPVLTTIWMVLFCLSMTFLSIAQEKNYEALLGEWDVQTEDGQYTFVFIFSMEDGALKGMFQGSTGEVEMEDLTYEDNELTFTVNVEAGGRSMPIDFSTTIEGETLEGMLSLEFGEANISGKKRE